MFTGIIQAVGSIAELLPRGGDMRIRLNTAKLPLSDVQLGDSIAVNGVCLTAVLVHEHAFEADVSQETLQRSTLGSLARGDSVNLELALTPTTRLGGHLVSGHVDGIGEVMARHRDARSERFELRAPAALMKYIAEKGSICVDGVSLTVNSVHADRFDLNIVPHTLVETTMATYKVGSKVNLEVDIIARYLERLLMETMGADSESPDSLQRGTTVLGKAFLAEHGFIKQGL